MTIEQFTAALPAYLGFFQDKSPCTQALKHYALELFVDFVSKEYPEQELTPEVALAFRQTLYGLEPNTVTQYMKQVRAAFSFLLDAGLLTGENPVHSKFVGQERYKPYTSLLTEADIQRLLRDECPEMMRGPVYLRARAMTLLCLTSGLRLAELMALEPADLDWEGGACPGPQRQGGQIPPGPLPRHRPGGGGPVCQSNPEGLPRGHAPVCAKEKGRQF